MKELKKFNGRCYGFEHDGKTVSHFCVGAYSVADCMRALAETGYHGATRTEITQYFSQCWGAAMNGITPERGVWVEYKGLPSPQIPVRIL